MIYSMTGFASANRDLGRGVLSLEFRSVNSRYLDLHFRMADELRSVEPALRELISDKLSRGKVECRLGFSAAGSSALAREMNEDALSRLSALEAQVRARLPQAAPLSVAEVLKWPGLFGDESVDPAALQAAVVEMGRQALVELAATREREGAKLAETIRERLVRIREIVREVAPLVPAAQAAYGEKLRQRLIEALGSADDERVRQEIVLFAQRADVAEELSRLSTHVDEVERVLKKGGGVGKRLDFLMQELNREANTLGSKAVVKEISTAAMELKLLIEQMREQIQNLE
jgi:uncharacterized protein (TIGR00255 family)